LLLNGKFLGYETLNSANFWVWYLENRTHLIEHYPLFRTIPVEHFALLGGMNPNILKAFPHIQALKKFRSPQKKNLRGFASGYLPACSQ
jgi:hypothetical protein